MVWMVHKDTAMTCGGANVTPSSANGTQSPCRSQASLSTGERGDAWTYQADGRLVERHVLLEDDARIAQREQRRHHQLGVLRYPVMLYDALHHPSPRSARPCLGRRPL
eukprot:scaffold185_cov321-Prasinococcus_capsulatus_cf.AAC.12